RQVSGAGEKAVAAEHHAGAGAYFCLCLVRSTDRAFPVVYRVRVVRLDRVVLALASGAAAARQSSREQGGRSGGRCWSQARGQCDAEYSGQAGDGGAARQGAIDNAQGGSY